MHRRLVGRSVAVAVLAFAGACGNDRGPALDAGDGEDAETTPVDGGGAAAADAGTVTRDVPCEVARLISTHCIECHCALGSETCLTFAPLVTAADFASESPRRPGRTLASIAVERMRAVPPETMPPSPRPPVPAEEYDAFVAWVSAGMPAGSCTTEP